MFTYRCTQRKTAFTGGEVIIISVTAGIAELIALSDRGVVVPTPYLLIAFIADLHRQQAIV